MESNKSSTVQGIKSSLFYFLNNGISCRHESGESYNFFTGQGIEFSLFYVLKHIGISWRHECYGGDSHQSMIDMIEKLLPFNCAGLKFSVVYNLKHYGISWRHKSHGDDGLSPVYNWKVIAVSLCRA